MRDTTLSLCMIVRNEESFLDECLASVAPVADEIIVVDTGSTDRTPAIARQYGANVIFHPWSDDFSEARNVGLERATGDWILVLDADEILDPAGHAEIREALRDESMAAYQMPVVNLYDRQQQIVSLITRLFRNHESVRFQNVIHEQVTQSLTRLARGNSLSFGTLNSRIIHKGYHPTVVEARKKDHRNLRLFQKQIEKHPDDIYSRYKYADFLRRYPDTRRPREAFATAYAMLYNRARGPRADLLFAGEIIAFHALYAYHDGEIRKADEICKKGLNDLPSATPNLLHIAGRIALACGDPKRAEELFRRCIAMDGHAMAVPGQPGITSYRSMAELAKVLHSSGRRDEAWQWFDQAVHQAAGESAEPILALAQCLVTEGRPAEALQCLSSYIRSWRETPELILMTGRVLLDIGNPAAAEKWFKRAIESQETEQQGRALLARARLFQGELQLAQNDWMDLPDAEREHAERFIGLIRGDDVDRAIAFGNPLERYVIGSFLRGLRAQGHSRLIDSFYENQVALDPATPPLTELYQPTSLPEQMRATIEFTDERVEIYPADVPQPTERQNGSSSQADLTPAPATMNAGPTESPSAPEPAPAAPEPAPTSTDTPRPAYGPEAPPQELGDRSEAEQGDAVPTDEELDQRAIAIDRPFVELFRDNGKVLDIGCGGGRFLDLLTQSGRDAVGVDEDPRCVDACRASGHNVESRDFTDLDSLPSDFDGVHAARVLETMTGREARKFLSACADRLKPGGMLIVRTRNWDNESVRDGSFWLEPDNVRPYPLPLLADLLEHAGFVIERRGHESVGWNDSYVVARQPAANGSDQDALDDPYGQTTPPRVVWEGEFFTAQSYALVNREIAGRWIRDRHAEVSLLPTDRAQGSGASHHATLTDRIHAPLTNEAEFHIRHRWPAAFYPPAEGRWIQIQPYEFGRIPKSWIAPILESVDEIWVPSHYARRCYTSSGVPEDRIAVVPNGVDCERFHPDVQPLDISTQKSFRFLFVGGSIWRKGIDVLLAAYHKAFRRTDNVTLIIKDVCQDTFYKDRNCAEQIRAMTADPDAPEVIYLEEELSEENLPRLYASCDVLVHPYRGEGFGLPVIEAMAMAKPVIVTRGGACDEFLAEGTCFDVAARRLNIQPAGLVLAGDGWVLEPDPDSLQAAMRTAFDQSFKLQSMGELAREHVSRNFSWARAADLGRRRLEALRNRVPRRRHPAVGVDRDPGPFEKVLQKLLTSDPEGAMEILLSEAMYRPDDPMIQHWMGMSFQQQGDLERARGAFEQALQVDRNMPEAWYNLGLVEANAGRIDVALSCMEAARGLGLQDSALFNDLGVLYSETGDYTQAELSVRRSLELGPGNTDAVYNLGMLWIRQGKENQARTLAEEVLASDPENPGARSLLARVDEAALVSPTG